MKRTILVCLLVGMVFLGLVPGTKVQAQEQTASIDVEKKTYTHIVVRGDTLWDICDTLYGDPWVWPKVWQLNPHITNPHWIYPGTRLEVFFELPMPMGQVAVVEEAAPAPPPPPPPPSPKAPAMTFADIDQVGFITPYTPRGMGIVAGEKFRKVLIGMDDEVFVQMRPPNKASVGDRYFIFRTSNLIRHPIKETRVGYLNTILGILEITLTAPDHAKATIVRSYQSIEAGDKLMPYKRRSSLISFEEPTEPKQGYIVLSQRLTRMMGERMIVFIDLGGNEEIKAGNRFEVFREPKATRLIYMESEIVLTSEPIGELLVLAVEKETCAAVVTQALGEFDTGERVRLIVKN